jgi:nitroreductase
MESCYELIKGLRVVRSYLPDPVSESEIRSILEAGRWTGSSKNTQRWAFVILRDEAARLDVASCGSFSKPLENAAFGVVLVRLPGGYDFDIGRAAQNMMLAAAALGIGSCPVTLHDEACARRILDVPEDHGCRYAIAFGYPDLERERTLRARRAIPGGRKPYEEVVHEGRFRREALRS